MKTRLSIDKHVVETKLTKISKKSRKKNGRKKRRRHDGSVPSPSSTTSFVQHVLDQPTPRRRNLQSATNNVWENTYVNVLKWQCEQQVSYWKNIARRYKVENAYLRGELKKVREHMSASGVKSGDCNKSGIKKETDDTAGDSVDEEFISFLEITAKHRLERVRQREEESD